MTDPDLMSTVRDDDSFELSTSSSCARHEDEKDDATFPHNAIRTTHHPTLPIDCEQVSFAYSNKHNGSIPLSPEWKAFFLSFTTHVDPCEGYARRYLHFRGWLD